jgi:cytochrome b561
VYFFLTTSTTVLFLYFFLHIPEQYKVEQLSGASGTEHVLAKLGHVGLYVFLTVMPASGIAMGYYGGMLLLLSSSLLFYELKMNIGINDESIFLVLSPHFYIFPFLY